MRFAALVRVSTDRQELKGESLHLQRKHCEENVASLKGTITEWYGGSEHATPGFEHKEVDRLLRDATKDKFDAVIVAFADRWSRDNAKSKEGLEILRTNGGPKGIRFFVGGMEMNLFDPMHRLILGMNAEINEFIAMQTLLKSVQAKIERARQGYPSNGRPPFGRIWNKHTKTWSVDAAKQKMIEGFAQRYLQGGRDDQDGLREGVGKLARIAGMSTNGLWKAMRHKAGPIWVQHFKCPRLNIEARIETPIPPLLPEATLQAIEAQARANKSGNKGRDYLLGGFVFCAGCGMRMTGENHKSTSYYIYRHPTRQKGECQCRVAQVNGEVLENAVLFELFSLFGNPAACEQALRDGTPNGENADVFQQRLDDATARLKKIEASRAKILRLITEDALTEDQARTQLMKLKEDEAVFVKERDQAAKDMEGMLTPQQIKDIAGRVHSRMTEQTRKWAREMAINTDLEGMTFEDKRSLLKMVFGGGSAVDGKPLGIYVQPAEGVKGKKSWAFRIVGRLTDIAAYTDDAREHDHLRAGFAQAHLVKMCRTS